MPNVATSKSGEFFSGTFSNLCVADLCSPSALSLATAADLRHYAIPELHSRLQQLEQQKKDEERQLRAAGGESLAGDTVTAEAIQQVVAQWSGIPVSNMKVRHIMPP